MSDNDTTKAKSGWSDKERLTYLFALIDNSESKFNYNMTPRPAGRSVIACQRMVERLKGTLKNELEALEAGVPLDDAAPKTPKTTTPRKRKVKDDADEQATPSKRGRKKKVVPQPEPKVEVQVEVEDESDGGMKIKDEPEGESDA
ncbi:hypothetical protein CC86DRAFT_471815 [Ophiobolus disseminans]|uniref:Uncharacterized protein n=1 Tax=Ophiobolus disseminans TaxID=1469910 RepID=A0A6A6ZHJ7_9PLEO|nr:hypothetical protein CC86DRAFT_471815 [Ophiobolus disseminans]